MLIEQPVFCATFVVPTDKECELSVLMLHHELCICFQEVITSLSTSQRSSNLKTLLLI